jgi:hypothetical protein
MTYSRAACYLLIVPALHDITWFAQKTNVQVEQLGE